MAQEYVWPTQYSQSVLIFLETGKVMIDMSHYLNEMIKNFQSSKSQMIQLQSRILIIFFFESYFEINETLDFKEMHLHLLKICFSGIQR